MNGEHFTSDYRFRTMRRVVSVGFIEDKIIGNSCVNRTIPDLVNFLKKKYYIYTPIV